MQDAFQLLGINLCIWFAIPNRTNHFTRAKGQSHDRTGAHSHICRHFIGISTCDSDGDQYRDYHLRLAHLTGAEKLVLLTHETLFLVEHLRVLRRILI